MCENGPRAGMAVIKGKTLRRSGSRGGGDVVRVEICLAEGGGVNSIEKIDRSHLDDSGLAMHLGWTWGARKGFLG